MREQQEKTEEKRHTDSEQTLKKKAVSRNL
jgi:hypothetical protein